MTQICSRELYRFLSRSLAVVPRGAEAIDLDRLVEELMGSSDAQ